MRVVLGVCDLMGSIQLQLVHSKHKHILSTDTVIHPCNIKLLNIIVVYTCPCLYLVLLLFVSCLILVVYSLRVRQVGVEITVGDIQDNCPLLTVNPLSVSVNEGRPAVDTNIGISISAEDRDSTSEQNTITLSLNGGSNPHFGIVTDSSTAGSVVSGCGCECVCVCVC